MNESKRFRESEHKASLEDSLDTIASMPVQGKRDPFSGQDHDRVLYGEGRPVRSSSIAEPGVRRMARPNEAPLLVMPVGTQVVTRAAVPKRNGGDRLRGSVGVVVQTPTDDEERYRIRFPDGDEASLYRHECSIRRYEQGRGLEPDVGVDWYRFGIDRCVVGSRAYGLDEPGSDTDYRGIYDHANAFLIRARRSMVGGRCRRVERRTAEHGDRRTDLPNLAVRPRRISLATPRLASDN
jgi:hypothetical protein